jgi:aromatic-L-amino-acid decarboxylase
MTPRSAIIATGDLNWPAFPGAKLWFVIRSYGVEGLRAVIREHPAGRAFFGLVEADRRFGSWRPRTWSLVCFRLNDGRREGESPPQQGLNARINDSGRCS